MKINLFGSEGNRTLEVRTPSQAPTTQPQSTALSPATLQEVIRLMPRRWLNMSELVIQLTRIHGIPADAHSVTEAIAYCEVETRGVGTQQEVRRHDDKASEQHRKATFACMAKLRPRLKRYNVTDDQLWDSIKERYGIESRTQLDTPQWASLAAELNAALRDTRLLKFLLENVK